MSISWYLQGWARDRDVSVSRPIHGLVSVSSLRYVQMSGLVSVSRADVSVSITTFQVSSPLLFSLKFTGDDSLLKLSALISSIKASTIIHAECSRTLLSVLHRCNIWRHLCLRKYLLLKWRVNSIITLKMNQQEDRDRVSDVIQFGQAVLCPATFNSSDFYGTSKFCSKWACFQQGMSK